MKKNCILLATAPTKERLTAMINEYFFSKNYTITDDMVIYNSAKNERLNGYIITKSNGRWRFSLLRSA